jgi:hypothetical protein
MIKTMEPTVADARVTAASPLTEEQIAEYYREGFIVVNGLVPTEEIDRVLEEAKKIPPNANDL